MTKLTVALALLALTATAATANKVHSLSPQDFMLMAAGKPIPGVDADSDPFHGHRHSGVWAVRFCLPWDCEGESAEDETAFAKAAAKVDGVIARFGELRLDSVEAFAIADIQNIAQLQKELVSRAPVSISCDFSERCGLLLGRSSWPPSTPWT